MSWREVWNSPHAIYVNERHRRIHYAHVADSIVAALPPRRPLTVIDFGCGEALDAHRLADAAGTLILYDTASRVRAGLAERNAGRANVRVVDEAGLRQVAPGSIDVIVAYSVIQYMTRDELRDALRQWRAWLRSDGMLLLVDVVQPGAGLRDDVAALLWTARRYGFVGAALRGLAATLVSPYAWARRRLGLTTYSEAEIGALLAGAGFSAERRPANLHFNRARMTLVGRPQAARRATE